MDEGRRDLMRRQQMLDDLARQQNATRRESLAELRHGLTEEELAERYDECMEEAGRSAGLREDLLSLAQVYSTELARRERERQGERMERLTRSITWLTWVIMGATIVGVVLTAVGLFFGG